MRPSARARRMQRPSTPGPPPLASGRLPDAMRTLAIQPKALAEAQKEKHRLQVQKIHDLLGPPTGPGCLITRDVLVAEHVPDRIRPGTLVSARCGALGIEK